jgi:hypothetical protein
VERQTARPLQVLLAAAVQSTLVDMLALAEQAQPTAITAVMALTLHHTPAVAVAAQVVLDQTAQVQRVGQVARHRFLRYLAHRNRTQAVVAGVLIRVVRQERVVQAVRMLAMGRAQP